MMNEQNHGLAAELEGHSFQPRINKTSQELSATMKSLSLRVPEMLAEKEKNLESKRKESEQQQLSECSFAPQRLGAKTSDLYLKRMGRSKLTPEDLFKFDEEKQRRIEVRRQIVSEMESRELTFRPQLSEKSVKLHERLLQRGAIEVDPATRTATPAASKGLSGLPSAAAAAAMVAGSLGHVTPSARRHGDLSIASSIALSRGAGAGGGAWQYEEGPMLQVESEHPYRHNTNEYTTVQVPNAVSYSISFTDNTSTEAIYDYVKFFDDETHTEYFGCGKYSGGKGGSPCNWPGVGTRPPLIIPAPKFIIHFKTNGSVNDWGFCMHVVPTLCVAPGPRMRQLEQERSATSFQPNISETARNYPGRGMGSPTGPNGTPRGSRSQQGGSRDPVHERLYKDAVERTTEHHNSQVRRDSYYCSCEMSMLKMKSGGKRELKQVFYLMLIIIHQLSPLFLICVKVDLMQNKLNVPLKPWENVRSPNAQGGLAHAYVKVLCLLPHLYLFAPMMEILSLIYCACPAQYFQTMQSY